MKNKIPLSALTLALFLLARCALTACAQQTIVCLSPTSYIVPNVNVTFSLNVTIDNVNGLFGWDFELYYPNDILNGTNIAEGEFLKRDGAPTLFCIFEFTDRYNATHGFARAYCMHAGLNVTGVNGSGVLATITFKSTSLDDPKFLNLENVELSNRNGTKIPCTIVNCKVTVVPEFAAILLMPFLIITNLVAVALRRKLHHKLKNSFWRNSQKG